MALKNNKTKNVQSQVRALAPIALVAIAAFAVGGIAFSGSLGSLTAALASSVVATSTKSDTKVPTATTPLHQLSYSGLDKGVDGHGIQFIHALTAGKPITVTVASTAAEIKRLAAYAKSVGTSTGLAYIRYDVYRGTDLNTPAIFGTSGEYMMKQSGTNIVGTIPLDFTASLMPGQYTVVVSIHANDYSFNLSDQFSLTVDNATGCQLKG